MKIAQGDLLALALDGEFDVIVHGCNCFCTMGAGIAKAVKATFPEAYEADCQTESGDRSKLGDYSFVVLQRDGVEIAVVNGYTQYHWKGPEGRADYEALRSVFASLRKQFTGKRIGYPKIGAGLAKGDWDLISKIIDEELGGEDHTLVEFSG